MKILNIENQCIADVKTDGFSTNENNKHLMNWSCC